MKTCSYCAEEIQDGAIKCKHCGSMLASGAPKMKWYFKTSIVVIVFLCVGPLALPLLWFNPRFSKKNKVIWSVVIMALTYYLGVALADALKSISRYYRDIF